VVWFINADAGAGNVHVVQGGEETCSKLQKNTTRFKQIEYLCVERTFALISQGDE